MTKLHKIMVRHYSQKDSHESVQLLVIADDDVAIRDKIDALQHGRWKEKGEDADEPFIIYDDEYNVIGTETYLERMLRVRGEINDPDEEVSDAYYGVTHYGWTEGIEITDGQAEILLTLDAASQVIGDNEFIQDWRFK